AALAFVGSKATSLNFDIIIAIVVAAVVGIGFAILEQRTRRAEQTLVFTRGPFRDHSRIDHLEGELALVRARLLLAETETKSAAESDLEHVVAAAFVAGFGVEHRPNDDGGRETLTFRPPPGSGIPAALTIGLGLPLTESVDSAANWLRAAGAPLGRISMNDK
ncbi:MAG: hypothetical protein QOI84_1171, partial [Solirubrobacterales bacterium]|nr:hypothetical protein [Solirubrobacterales bacterium]